MRSPHVFPGLLTGLVYKRSKVRKFEGSSYGKEEKKTIFFNVYKALIVFVRKLSSSPLALLCYPHCSFVTVSFEIPLRVPPPSFLPSFLYHRRHVSGGHNSRSVGFLVCCHKTQTKCSLNHFVPQLRILYNSTQSHLLYQKSRAASTSTMMLSQ